MRDREEPEGVRRWAGRWGFEERGRRGGGERRDGRTSITQSMSRREPSSDVAGDSGELGKDEDVGLEVDEPEEEVREPWEYDGRKSGAV